MQYLRATKRLYGKVYTPLLPQGRERQQEDDCKPVDNAYTEGTDCPREGAHHATSSLLSASGYRQRTPCT